MPLYEYECDACGGRFEVIQKFSEITEACRRCGQGPVRRLVAAPAFQFKGTGWYITDYAQKGKPAGEPAAAGKAEASEPAAKTDKKSDGASESTTTKPASPAATTTKD